MENWDHLRGGADGMMEASAVNFRGKRWEVATNGDAAAFRLAKSKLPDFAWSEHLAGYLKRASQDDDDPSYIVRKDLLEWMKDIPQGEKCESCKAVGTILCHCCGYDGPCPRCRDGHRLASIENRAGVFRGLAFDRDVACPYVEAVRGKQVSIVVSSLECIAFWGLGSMALVMGLQAVPVGASPLPISGTESEARA